MASKPELELARVHALHPRVPHLATCDADGHLRVGALGDNAPLATAQIALGQGVGPVLAHGGSAQRPMLAWVGDDGLPWLWAYGQQEGLASAPTRLEHVERFVPRWSGGSGAVQGVWLSGHGRRSWVVFDIHPGGALLSNGRLSVHLDPPRRIIGAAASPNGDRVAILGADGLLQVFEDPQNDPCEQTDALGPALLLENVAACPAFTLRPAHIKLPIGGPKGFFSGHANAFWPVSHLQWVDAQRIAVHYQGPNQHKSASLEPEGRFFLLEVFDDAEIELLDERPLPGRVAPGGQIIESGHPLYPKTFEGMAWLVPDPRGALCISSQWGRQPAFIDAQTLSAAHQSVRWGHPRALEALRSLGLRWDGQEILLDTLRPDIVKAFGGEGARPSGPVEPVVVYDDGVQRLFIDPEHAERIVLFRPSDVPVGRILFHPVLSRLPDYARWRAKGGPTVRLVDFAIDAKGEILAMWRRPGGVEMWSLYVGDRLKAWRMPWRQDVVGRKLLLRDNEPGFLPTMVILEAKSGGKVSVSALDFGDRAPTALGEVTSAAIEALQIEDLHHLLDDF